MRFSFRLLGIVGRLALVATSAGATEISFRSGPAPVALVELYTSEGCSSCPPAEKWLAALRHAPELWKSVVPVAFHVNYWDKLGWRDVLATKEFTERQYAYAETWRSGSVYTPCFVRNGAEWHVPASGSIGEKSAKADAGELTLGWQDDATCLIRFAPPARDAKPNARFTGSVALLGGGIVSAVRAGENSGRELQHEFVALRLESVTLTRDADGNFVGRVVLAPPTDRKLPPLARRAVAGWITPAGQHGIVQAAGGWLP